MREKKHGNSVKKYIWFKAFHRDHYCKDKNNVFQMTIVESRGNANRPLYHVRYQRDDLVIFRVSMFLSLFLHARIYMCVYVQLTFHPAE